MSIRRGISCSRSRLGGCGSSSRGTAEPWLSALRAGVARGSRQRASDVPQRAACRPPRGRLPRLMGGLARGGRRPKGTGQLSQVMVQAAAPAFVLGAVAAFVSILHGRDKCRRSIPHVWGHLKSNVPRCIASRRAAAHFGRVTGDCLVSTVACGCRACWSVLSCYATVLVRAPGRGVAPDIRYRTLVGADRKRATMHGAHWVICGGGGGTRGRQRATSTATTYA